MGIARALLSFYGVPDSTTVKKDGQRTRIDGMTEAGLQKVANQRVQINVLTTHKSQEKETPKHTCSSRSSRSNPEKSCLKSFPNKPCAMCPHDEF
jgi:hypothetical protein